MQGTWGQKLDDEIVMPDGAAVVKKGITTVADSYGAFENNVLYLSDTELSGNDFELATASSLNKVLEVAGVKTVYMTGLALDYCVKYTSLQAVELGYKTVLVEDATKPVFESGGVEAIELLKEEGVKVVQASDVATCHRR